MRGSFFDEDLPLGNDAFRVFESALAEAKRLRHPYVGSEHFVLALLHGDYAVPRRVLAQLNVDRDRVEERFSEMFPEGTKEVGATWELPYNVSYTDGARRSFSFASNSLASRVTARLRPNISWSA